MWYNHLKISQLKFNDKISFLPCLFSVFLSELIFEHRYVHVFYAYQINEPQIYVSLVLLTFIYMLFALIFWGISKIPIKISPLLKIAIFSVVLQILAWFYKPSEFTTQSVFNAAVYILGFIFILFLSYECTFRIQSNLLSGLRNKLKNPLFNFLIKVNIVVLIALVVIGFSYFISLKELVTVPVKKRQVYSHRTLVNKNVDFTFPIFTSSGTPINRDSLHNKILFIYFWSPGCKTCLQELHNLQILFEQFKKSEVKFLFLTNEPPVNTLFLREKYKYDSFYFLDSFPSWVKGNVLPQTFILSKDSRIIFHQIGATNLSNDSLNALIRIALSSQGIN